MKKIIIAALITITTTAPALAWGDREQGVLSGIAGYWLYQRLSQPQIVGQVPPPVIQQPQQPPVVIFQQNCRNILTVEVDRWGNEIRRPITICQ